MRLSVYRTSNATTFGNFKLLADAGLRLVVLITANRNWASKNASEKGCSGNQAEGMHVDGL